MTVFVFAVGILVFLITVYGTVMVGGLLLTDRRIEEEPDLAPDTRAELRGAETTTERARKLIVSKF